MERGMRGARGRLVGVVLALVLGATLIWWLFFSEFAKVDDCLDAGGRWADGGYCEGARPGG